MSRGTGYRFTAPLVMALACVAALAAVLAGSRFAPNKGKADALRLNEVMSSNGSAVALSDGSLPDWVEIENTSDQPIDLTGYALMNAAKPNRAFAFPGGVLDAGARAVVYCDGSDKALVNGEYHAPFRLPASGATLALLNRKGIAADVVALPALGKDQVYCRDESGEWTIEDYAAPGNASEAAEAAAEPGALAITEVMSRNCTYIADENGEHPDYIEIHNTSRAPVSLSGWSLSDATDDLRKWVFPDVTLPADGYMLVRCTGKDDPERLCAGFRLARSGEEITLADPDGAVIDRVTLPALESDQAYVLADSGWAVNEAPSPGHANDREGAEAAAGDILTKNAPGIYITELLAASSQTGDWIELANASSQPVDLSGFGLSDNAAKPRKWQFPAGTVIQPGAYLTVWADNNADAGDGALHADFLLSAAGGYPVVLSDSQGRIFDRVFVPAQYRDIAYGRTATLSGLRYFTSPTPGAANSGDTCYGRAPAPAYTTDGGLFQSGDVVTVGMSAPEGCEIRYTLDCTDPTRSSTLYTGPVTITGTTILRTRVYCDGYLESFMDTQSYLFDVNNGGNTVYVASLVSDPDNLFGEENGIMAMGPNALPEYPHGSLGKGANFWMNWEREGHIEIFRPDASTLLTQACGVRLHGNSSRPQDQKAFKITARSQYGDSRFRAALFTRRPYTEYKGFLLRTGSQDIKKTHMRDEILQSLARDLHLMYQEYEVAVLYLNGEFWGHYNIREMVNTESICQFEGWEGDEDDIDFINKDRVVLQGSGESLKALFEWLKGHDVNTDEAYRMMDAAVDLENYLGYIALEMYVGNYDTQNVKCYRNPKADGKWRWILYDLDCGFDIDTNSVRRWLDPEGMGRDKETDNQLFVACMKNDRTRDWFLQFLGDEMAATYSADNIKRMIADYRSLVAPILPDQLSRWGMSQAEYEKEVGKLISYAETRPMRMLQFLKGAENLHLTQAEMERYFGAAMEQAGVTYEQIKAE